jgi:hypothetical protein
MLHGLVAFRITDFRTRDDTDTRPQQHTQAQILGPVFVKHRYVFLYLFGRGEGLSADQGAFIGDILQRAEAAKGEEARKPPANGLHHSLA